MIHCCSRCSSDARCDFVSRAVEIVPELLESAVDQHAQVVAVHLESLADRVFVEVVEIDGAQDLGLPRFECVECAVYVCFLLGGDEVAQQVDIGRVDVVENLGRMDTPALPHDVVAEAEDERAEPLAVANLLAAAEVHENPEVDLLLDVIDVAERHASQQPSSEEKIEVFEIVIHSGGVAVPQTPYILVVKREEIHKRGNSYFTASKGTRDGFPELPRYFWSLPEICRMAAWAMATSTSRCRTGT